jgi:hypothetical protein
MKAVYEESRQSNEERGFIYVLSSGTSALLCSHRTEPR